MIKAFVLLVTLLPLLISCDSSNDLQLLPEPTAPAILTGVLLDSPVINIGYRTATQNGVTNAQGEYKYISGENVVFFIGDLIFPSVKAKAIITPLDLAGVSDTSNSTVINIARLLQTLDKDGNSANGINITTAAISAATQVDFSLDEASFSTSSAVLNLISNGGQDTAVTALISMAIARANFEQQLVDGGLSTSNMLNFDASVVVNNTSYQVTSNDQSCPTMGWYVEPMTFTSTGGATGTYTIDDCDLDPALETGTYVILNSGIVQITSNLGVVQYIQRTSFDASVREWNECWADTELDTNNCTDLEISHVFIDQAVISHSLNQSLAFTSGELSETTIFNAFDNDPSCPTTDWYVEPIIFSAEGTYTLNNCNDETETGVYSILESGVIQITATAASTSIYIQRKSFNSAIGEWSMCWANSELASASCSDADLSYSLSLP